MEAGTHGRRSDRSVPTAPAWLLHWLRLMLSGSIARNAARNLASSLKRQGKYAAEAETIYCTVLGVMKRVLGAEHSITLLTVNNLATFLAHQDEPAKPSGQQPSPDAASFAHASANSAGDFPLAGPGCPVTLESASSRPKDQAQPQLPQCPGAS
jgi:hypothetical protein